MTASRTGPTRRLVLSGMLAGLGGLAACSVGEPEGSNDQAPGSPTEQAPTPDPCSPQAASLPAVTPWTPAAREVEPACKVAAVSAVTRALTRSCDEPPPSSPATAALRQFVPEVGPSALQVIYPQYGGLTDDRRLASVMLVAEHLTLSADNREVTRNSITVDVRMERPTETWTVSEVLVPAARVTTDRVGPAAQAVLDDPRIMLPGEARLDLADGGTDERVSRLLTSLATQWPLRVQVLRAGHPRLIFGTDRVSKHIDGRAVDLWALDDVPVIEHATSPWREVMEAAADFGANQVGGPGNLGGRRPFFTDPVHHDHLHIGFDPLPAPRPT